MSKRILIIEDNEYIGRMYQEVLSLAGFQVEWVTNGKEGLERAKDNPPDLLLLDVIMPQINGVEVLKNLKSNPLTKGVKVVILTILTEKEVIDKCLNLGAEGYIIKSSVDIDQLLTEVKSFLS